ncbi:hypothetical protein [Aliamphritea spongicola]|nr:hypothetical protein [Aliamphritea spongicola]
MLVVHRFKVKLALRRSLRPLPLTATVVLFLLGLAAGVQAEERVESPVLLTPVPAAGIQLYVPAQPEWIMGTSPRSDAVAVIMSTPVNYYPPTAIEITYHPRWLIPEDEPLLQVAVGTLNSVREKLGVKGDSEPGLRAVSYGSLEGYEEQLSVVSEEKGYQLHSFWAYALRPPCHGAHHDR